jgi:hypothetical protein
VIWGIGISLLLFEANLRFIHEFRPLFKLQRTKLPGYCGVLPTGSKPAVSSLFFTSGSRKDAVKSWRKRLITASAMAAGAGPPVQRDIDA